MCHFPLFCFIQLQPVNGHKPSYVGKKQPTKKELLKQSSFPSSSGFNFPSCVVGHLLSTAVPLCPLASGYEGFAVHAKGGFQILCKTGVSTNIYLIRCTPDSHLYESVTCDVKLLMEMLNMAELNRAFTNKSGRRHEKICCQWLNCIYSQGYIYI